MNILEKLAEAGLGEDLAKAAEKVLQDAIKDAHVPLHRFNEKNDQVKTLQEQIKERDAKIKELGKSTGTAEELKAQLEQAQKELKESDKAHAKELEKVAKLSACRFELGDKAHDADMVLNSIDLDKIIIDDSNKVVSGFKEQVEPIIKEKPFLFKETNPTDNNPGGGNPGDNKGDVLFKIFGEDGTSGNKKPTNAKPGENKTLDTIKKLKEGRDTPNAKLAEAAYFGGSGE